MGCTEAEQKQLLGLGQAAFDELTADKSDEMSNQVLQRISYLMGIARALDKLYPTNDRAAERIRKPTTDEPFYGLSPLAFMLADPQEGPRLTRRYFQSVDITFSERHGSWRIWKNHRSLLLCIQSVSVTAPEGSVDQ